MKYEEFDKLIEEQNRQKKQERLQRIKEGLNFPAEMQCGAPAAGVSAAQAQTATAAEKQARKPAGKRRTSFKNFFKTPARLAACVSAAMAVACLAIILPFALNNSNSPQTATTKPSTTPEDRFCAAATCKEIELKYSLKEYSQLNKLFLLYVDWYDVADIKTSMHVNKEDSTDIIYYEEILKHKYTGSIVEFYISEFHTNVDKIIEYRKVCKNLYVGKYPRYIKAMWGSDTDENGDCTYSALFQYGKHFYTLVLRYPMDEHSIFELIDLISANKK